MNRKLSDAEVMGIAIGSLVAIALAGILGSLRTEVDQANAALALVLVVIVAAYTGGRWAGAATGVVAALAFDFFLTKPYQSLAIKSSDDVLTTVLLLSVGLAVGQIATARREARLAERAGTEDVAALYRVARLVASEAPDQDLIAGVTREVAAVMRLRECRFERLPLDPPLPHLDHEGRVDAPYVFEGDGFVLPATGLTISLRAGTRTLGWLVCLPAEGGTGISRDRRRTALVLADHLALALATRSTSDDDRP